MHCRDHDDVVNDGVLGRVSREEKCIDLIDEVLELGGRYLQRRRKSAARGGPIKGPEGTHPTLELKRKRRVKPACTINQNVSRPSHSSRDEFPRRSDPGWRGDALRDVASDPIALNANDLPWRVPSNLVELRRPELAEGWRTRESIR